MDFKLFSVKSSGFRCPIRDTVGQIRTFRTLATRIFLVDFARRSFSTRAILFGKMLSAFVQDSLLWEYVRTVLWGCLFLTFVAGWLFLKRLPALFRSIRSADWPMVEGDIESATVSAFAEQSLAQLGYS